MMEAEKQSPALSGSSGLGKDAKQCANPDAVVDVTAVSAWAVAVEYISDTTRRQVFHPWLAPVYLNCRRY